jgi:hypothetical protein
MELGPGICHSVTPMVRSSASGWRAATRCIRLIPWLHNVALAAYAYQRRVSFVLASKRSVFGLAELAPLRDGVAPARHPEPGRGRGRPPIIVAEEEVTGPQPHLLPLTPLERRSFNYSGLEAAMAFADEAIRYTRHGFGMIQRAFPTDLEGTVGFS